MGAFWTEQLDYVFFLYGLAFVLLGGVSWNIHRRRVIEAPWLWLMTFGLVHCLYEWVELSAVTFGGPAWIGLVRVMLLGASFLCLGEFARRSLRQRRWQRRVLGAEVVLLVVGTLGAWWGAEGLSTGWRWTVAVPTIGLTAWILWRRVAAHPRLDAHGRWWTRGSAVALGLYGLTQILGPAIPIAPSWGWHQDWLLTHWGVPVQIIRAALAGTVALTLGQGLTLAEEDRRAPWRERLVSPQMWVWGVLPAVLALGWGGTQWLGLYGRHNEQVRQQEQVQLEITGMNNVFALANRVVQAMAQDMQAEQEMAPITAGQNDAWVDRFALILPQSVCYVLDDHGVVLASSNRAEPDSFVGRNYAMRPYFTQAMSGQAGQYLAIGMTSREPGYYASAPVYRAGKVTAVAVVKASLRKMSVLSASEEIICLVDASGGVLVSNKGRYTNRPLWPMDEAQRDQLLGQQQFTFRSRLPVLPQKVADNQVLHWDGRPYLVALRQVPLRGWNLVKIDRSRHEPMLRLLAIGAVGLVVVLVLGAHGMQSRALLDGRRLAESERRNRGIVEGSPHRVELYDALGRLQSINHAGLTMMGWQRAQVVGKSILELWPAAAQKRLLEALERLRGGEAVRLELESRRSDGAELVLDLSLNPVVDPRLGLQHIVSVCSDQTSRVRTYEALRQNRAQLASALDLARLAHWEFDVPAQTFNFDLPYFRVIHQAEPQWLDARRMTLADYCAAWLAPEQAQRLTQYLQQAATAPPTHHTWQFDLSVRRTDAQNAEVVVRFQTVRDDEGAVVRLLGITQDITEAKQAERALSLTQFAVDHASDAVYWVDRLGRLRYVNHAACAMLGYPPAQLLNMTIMDLDPALSAADWPARWEEYQVRGRRQFETYHRTQDQRVFPVEISASYAVFDDQEHLFVFARDITDRKQAEEALKQSEQRYALAERGTNDGLWDWDLVADRIYFSPRALELLGSSDSVEPDPSTWFDRIDSSDATQFQADLTFHLAGRTTHFHNEHRITCPDGTVRWLFCRGVASRDDKGVAVRMAGSLSDITDRKRVEEQLRQVAQTDRLTGLINRPVILELIERAIRHTRLDPTHAFAVLFLDFDRFKIINDSLGHAAGDQLLIEIARRLRMFLDICPVLSPAAHDASCAARLGGDEFLVLLDNLGQSADAVAIAQQLQSHLSEPYNLHGHEVRCTVSIGITTSEAGHRHADEVVRDADTAMYRAKAGGKARHVVFDNTMHQEVAGKLALESELRRALEAHDLCVHYQPLVGLESGKLIGFEALVRWQHAQRGWISPVEFIPVAEETGLIIPLGAWVLHEAAKQLKAWRAQFGPTIPLRLNVNLSRCQLLHSGLIAETRKAVESAGVSPRDIHLEITESVVMEETDHVLPVLKQLKEMGFLLDLDDFGTGYSSLACLHRFPVNGLKIDRSFIRNMTDHPDYTAVVHAIVTLAHSLNMSVTAEGVETSDQVVQLQTLDCDLAQGYYFSKPMPASEAASYLRKPNTLLRRPA